MNIHTGLHIVNNHAKPSSRLCSYRLFFLFFVLETALFSQYALADRVEEKYKPGFTLTANFHEGNSFDTALLFLHGFLQTGQSEPMSSLAGNLASKGYSTLNPTFSLGISKRQQSTPCEAVHTHTLKQDLEELDYWLGWLQKKGFRKIILIGFSSTGNIAALEYTAQKPRASIQKVILVSLNPVVINHTERSQLRNRHAKTKSGAQGDPQRYTLGYCKGNFAASPESYLSYAQYDEDKILDLIRLTSAPSTFIMGSADTILPARWNQRIATIATRPSILTVPNANHFFDGTAEFDLAEKVEEILKSQVGK